jgi:hypothetical protein
MSEPVWSRSEFRLVAGWNLDLNQTRAFYSVVRADTTWTFDTDDVVIIK